MSRRVVGWAVALVLAASAVRAQSTQPTPEELLQRTLAKSGDDTNPLQAAQLPNMASSPALSGPIDPETYRLGPGDRLVVQWSGRVTRSEYADVGPAGDVFLSEIGSLNVAGQTLAAARAVILERLRRITRDVRVEVQLARPRTFRVYLGGAVSDPGPLEAAGNSRASDVVRPSALLEGASRRNLRVIHRDGSEERADLERLYRMGDHSHDAWLRDGDAIVVPLASEFVSVTGAVADPGKIERAPGDSASTLLRLAGGPLPGAAPDGVEWLHWSAAAAPETLRVTLDELVSGTKDGPLAHGDHLFVRYLPEYRLTGVVKLEGEVERPGTYPIAAGGTHLSAVLAAAGGMLPTANRSAIRVRHKAPEHTSPDPDLTSKLQAMQRDLTITEYEASQAYLASLGNEVIVDWASVQKSPQALDLLLRDGDEILVERNVPLIRIDGQVRRPGVLAYDAKLDVKHYIQQAGGFTERAWQGHEQVTRPGSSHTLLARDVKALHAGDFIWVPTRPETPISRTTGQFLTAMAQIATVILAIRSLK